MNVPRRIEIPYLSLLENMVALYAGMSLWLFFMTDAPQAVPFEYQVS